jgi:uncharacterized Ntn-hydrolase superfamily protein
MTFSIVAVDAERGELGVAVASKFLAVGAAVPWARAGVGAVATQALANLAYGRDGLALLEQGADPVTALRTLTGADELREHRQLGIVDARGVASSYTGGRCLDWAGGRTGEGVALQGNILAGPAVVDAMLEAWLATPGGDRLVDRLLAALRAGDEAGGDRRGRQSAAVLVVREGGGYMGGDDRACDLRVDDHPDPIAEVMRLRAIHALLFERPDESDLLPLDDGLAAELRSRLEGLPAEGAALVDLGDVGLADLLPPTIGTPRGYPSGWDDAWQGRLQAWMAVENLEERMAAPGWIDPAVLGHLRGLTRR